MVSPKQLETRTVWHAGAAQGNLILPSSRTTSGPYAARRSGTQRKMRAKHSILCPSDESCAGSRLASAHRGASLAGMTTEN